MKLFDRVMYWLGEHGLDWLPGVWDGWYRVHSAKSAAEWAKTIERLNRERDERRARDAAAKPDKATTQPRHKVRQKRKASHDRSTTKSGTMSRLCACGCGANVAGRADKLYLNPTHAKRVERTMKAQGVSISATFAEMVNTMTEAKGDD